MSLGMVLSHWYLVLREMITEIEREAVSQGLVMWVMLVQNNVFIAEPQRTQRN